MMNDMLKTYYCLWYRLDDTDGYLIWYSNDHDGVVVQSDGAVPSFGSLALLHTYAAAHQIVIKEEEPGLHNLDRVETWLNTPTLSSDIDCADFLADWNLFGDISASTNGSFDHDQKLTQDIYEKIFYGNNLPAMTPPGKHYTPIWTEAEITLMWKILSDGMSLFRKVVHQL